MSKAILTNKLQIPVCTDEETNELDDFENNFSN